MYTVFYSSETQDRYSDCRVSCTIASIAVTFSYVGTRMYNNNFTDISRCEGFYIVTVKLFYFKLCLSLKLHEKTWLFQTSIMLCRMHIRYREIKTQGYNQQLLQHFNFGGFAIIFTVFVFIQWCQFIAQCRNDKLFASINFFHSRFIDNIFFFI